ncbi:MAG: hypothetical protein VB096_04060 [Pseudoflavonifractor sp.]|nr:hypothetical protein [Pseudoflavonifractor sp.]
MERKKLKREIEREALARMEDAARTEADFQNVTAVWDRLAANRERREQWHEIGRTEKTLALGYNDGEILPNPAGHVFWRQLMRGDFLDIIFDCPYELHELVEDMDISALLRDLSENHREILYFSAIRLYSSARLAAMRKQTDRNIRKTRVIMLKKIHGKLIPRLAQRAENGLPVTLAQLAFLKAHAELDNTRR